MAIPLKNTTTPTTHNAFFYGTLMAPSVLSRVTTRSPESLHTRPAILPSHRRHRVRSADYPALLPSPGNTVRGTYVSGLSATDMARLDAFEGPEYARVGVRVALLPAPAAHERGGLGSGKEAAVSGVQAQITHAVKGEHEDASRDEVEGAEMQECETYVWKDDVRMLEDEEWDFAEFTREKLWRWAGDGADQREYEACDDVDPTGGRGVVGKEG